MAPTNLTALDVVLRKQIHGSFSTLSSLDVWIERRFTLPFPPYPGLSICDGDWESPPLSEIYWDVQKNRFRCYAESDKEIYEAVRHRRVPRPMEVVVQEYLDAGWQREKDDE